MCSRPYRPFGLPIYVARAPRLHCISSTPAALDRYPRRVAGHVAHPVRSILAATHRGFAFYVACPTRSIETRSFSNSLAASLAVLPSLLFFPKASIRPLGFPIYVARVPAAPFIRCPHLARCPPFAALPSMSLIPQLHCSLIVTEISSSPWRIAFTTLSFHQNRVTGYPRPIRKELTVSRRKVRALRTVWP